MLTINAETFLRTFYNERLLEPLLHNDVADSLAVTGNWMQFASEIITNEIKCKCTYRSTQYTVNLADLDTDVKIDTEKRCIRIPDSYPLIKVADPGVDLGFYIIFMQSRLEPEYMLPFFNIYSSNLKYTYSVSMQNPITMINPRSHGWILQCHITDPIPAGSALSPKNKQSWIDLTDFFNDMQIITSNNIY